MPNSGEKVEFENERVKVSRIKINQRPNVRVRVRKGRVLVWLTDAHEMRTEPSGKKRDSS